MNHPARKIGFIGAGNMAEAMIGALLQSGQASAKNIRVSDINDVRTAQLKDTYGVVPTAENAEVVAACDMIVFAVKPQVIDGVLQDLAAKNAFSGISGRRLLVSIAAGIPIARIEAGIYDGCTVAERKNLPIIRVMPNTPALVGAGMSGMCANTNANPSDIETAKRVLSAMGRVMILDEKKMDAVTALSGSGPAYGFYVLEAMIEAGENLGLKREEAEMLARTALSGALTLIDHKNESPESLRAKVTSPGGTTEAATRVLEENNVKGAIIKAIAAAAKRARQLSKPSDNH